MNPYRHLVTEIARLVREGRQYPLGGFPTPSRPQLPDTAPTALVFSPHPDDECIIGGLALRMQRETGVRVVNVAVTQGSKKERRAGRWDELRAACDYLGFDLLATVPGGLERINVKTNVVMRITHTSKGCSRRRWTPWVATPVSVNRERWNARRAPG